MNLLAIFRPLAASAWSTVVRAVVGIAVFVVLLPLCALLAAVFLAVDLVATPVVWVARLKARRPEQAPLDAPSKLRRSVSIVTVTFNGKHFLEKLLPSLLAEVARTPGEHEVIVVENGSTDGSVEYVRQNYPTVKLVALPENRFFVRGNMAGVKEATKDILVFLNNDMVVKEGFLNGLLEGFTHPDVFGVSAEIFFHDPAKRREETGKTSGRFRGGFLDLAHDLPGDRDAEIQYTPTFWAGGGSAAFDRAKFFEIGGFDLVFDPFYLEDTGLSYQAWKRGWRVLFTPRAGTWHAHRGTSRKVFGDDYIDNIIRRNQHLFIWRNIVDPIWTLEHFLRTPYNVLKRAYRSGRPFVRGVKFEVKAFLKALPRLGEVLWKRSATRPAYRRSDRKVLAIANHLHRYRRELGAQRDAISIRREGMRLLILCGRLPRLNTDGSWILFNLVRELARRHKVTLFALLDSSEEDAQAAPLREFCEEVVTVVRQSSSGGLDLHHRVPERLARDYSAYPMRAALQRLLETRDYDLVQVEYVEMAHLVQDLVAGLPVVHTCHEPLNLFYERIYRQSRGLFARCRAWWQWAQSTCYEVSLLKSFRHVVALSDVDQHNLKGYVRGLEVTTIPSGIDVSAYPERDPAQERRPRVAFVGYFRHPPNVDGAVWLAREVFPLVRRQVPEAELVLVGKDPTSEVLALRSLPGVEVTGFVPDILPYMMESAVMAVPIRLGGGLRGKVLEAWAAGKALVSTRIACEGFHAQDGENVLLADDAAGFAAALVRCLRDPELRSKLGAAGRRVAQERYSCEAMARSYEKLYGEILGFDISRLPAQAPTARPMTGRSAQAVQRG
ncbi:MAG: glycosyltransferase [Planctomycetes bacterium]|nr:glycosyltransferase [Planctomycetota bacterium]